MTNHIGNPVDVEHHTIGGPDSSPGSVSVKAGSTLELHNDSHTYPEFEIEFFGATPAKDGQKKLKAINNNSIKFPVTDTGGVFIYKLHHKKPNEKPKTSGPFMFSVHPCGACP
jgi:hypothetical protein